ncbi:PadR family transcriptional regulator [Nocardiopsis changdeensis]|uniref:PadR family transcriptional regulator n=1 Tax=Nocardiopsis changdeensis TaxID=2831969 RepID=A0ABX8BTJ8_9ACTN|nr:MULTISPECIES: PadR family transcriptional regulator [Nocardiopsis]QUX25332.1 PadR family transcriptional regulator [Nocardiopsis changdeensis]QYX35719.1 PadR family transcriptional regulator [Nocardiopsis sp. MT53]
MEDLTEMLKGTLEGCVLEIIGGEETYGYAITRRLNELGFADVVEGTVYTILLRLEKNGLVQVTKRPSGVGPPRKFYALNDAGRAQLATFWAKWDYVSDRIEKLRKDGR